MKKKFDYFILFIPILYAVMAVFVIGTVMKNGVYPEGSDALYHVYRGDFVYRAIGDGNWYPLFAKEWYNGVELLRYGAPLPAYFMAFCQFLAGGDVLNGYLIFVGMIFFLGAIAWLFVGWRKQRICLGAFIGALWFFMPNNLYAMFTEGNLARCVCMIFLPLFIDAAEAFFETKKRCWVIVETLLFALMALCDLWYAGMIALGMLVYVLVHRLYSGRESGNRQVLYGILLGFMLTGAWLVPALTGGLTAWDKSENMVKFFQPALLSLNPLERYEGGFVHFYFGLAAALIALLGMFMADKKHRAGFTAGIVFLVCTTDTAYYLLKVLPGSEYLWMLRFISIALCMILYSLLDWRRLRKYILCIVLLLLVADAVPSLPLLYGNQSGTSAAERLDEMQETTLIQEGLELTGQRIALMDASSLEARGAFLCTGWNDGRDATFGAGWEAAVTARNIRNLNVALESGYFSYMFDRCKEMGNDTVVVRLSCLPKGEGEAEKLAAAAKVSGYTKIKEQNGYQLYHLDGASGNWGVKTGYEAIAIGADVIDIAMQFPAVEEGSSDNLNDYSYEKLSEYNTIYLGAFSYDDKESAEEMILRLSEAGVKIVISADGIPEDNKEHNQSFLGVRCEKISFQNGYPELIIYDKLINPDLFPKGYSDWQTVYTEGLDSVEGYLLENELEIPFLGTVVNENITVIGLGLPQFCRISRDATMSATLSGILGYGNENVPKRELIPIEVEYGKNSVRIVSPVDDLNTTISYHTIFQTGREIGNVNNLMVVDAGLTEIEFVCKELVFGWIVTGCGVILVVLYAVFGRIRRKAPVTKTFVLRGLVTGADDELGAAVIAELESRGIEANGLAFAELDMTDDYAIEHIIGQRGWDVVIHCAGFVWLDNEAGDEVLYDVGEMTGTERMREACIAHNIPFIEGNQIGDKLPANAKEVARLLADKV